MRRFRYVRDPACLLACTLYALNRWVIAPRTSVAFLHNQFDDSLLIPAALPPLLWVQRMLGLRPNDAMPGWAEVLLHLVVWSIAAEVVAPHLFKHAVGDIWDVVAYTVGAVLATLWWQRP